MKLCLFHSNIDNIAIRLFIHEIIANEEVAQIRDSAKKKVFVA